MTVLFAMLWMLGSSVSPVSMHPLDLHRLIPIGARQFHCFDKDWPRQEHAKKSSVLLSESILVSTNRPSIQSLLELEKRSRITQVGFVRWFNLYGPFLAVKQGSDTCSADWLGTIKKSTGLNWHWSDHNVTKSDDIVGGSDSPVFDREMGHQTPFRVEGKLGWGDGNVSAQFSPTGLAGFPERPNEKCTANDAYQKAPIPVFGRVLSGIRRFPLGAKIALTFVLSLIAASVLFRGFTEISDGGRDTISGLGYFAFGLALIVLALWLAGPYR